MRDTTTANGVTTVALNSHIKSQRSIHIVGGFDYQFRMLGRPFRFTAEAYYKKLDHLIPYNMQNMKIVYEGITSPKAMPQESISNSLVSLFQAQTHG